MTIQQVVNEIEEKLGHLSDLKGDPKDPSKLIHTIYKCLYFIIIIFLSFVESLGKDYYPFRRVFEDCLNDLSLFKHHDRELETEVEMEQVHVKAYSVEEHDEWRPVHHQSRREHEQAFFEMIDENLKLTKELDKTRAELDQQKQEREELEERLTNLALNLNSRTSNTPSSKEARYLKEYIPYRNGEKRENEEDFDSNSPKKAGGRLGHPGYQAFVDEETLATETVCCYPKGMSQKEAESLNWKEGASHYYVDLRAQTSIIRYIQMETTVSGKRGPKRVKGNFPKEAMAKLTYGTGVKREVFLLYCIGFVSMKNMSQILQDNYGLAIAPSTINTIIKKTSANFIRVRDMIAERLRQEAKNKDRVFQMDETSVNIDSINYWDHILLSNNFVLHTIHPSRGLEGARESGIFDRIQGTVISDFFKNYLNRDFDNAFCFAHLEREIEAALVRDGDSEWLKLMKEFAIESYRAWKKAHKEQTQIPDKELKRLLDLYDQAVNTGLKETNSSKTRALLLRFANFKTGIVAHLVNPALPRTNNAAEKAARVLKRKMDVSVMFKTEEGAENYAALISVVESAKLQGLNPIETIDQIVGGNLMYLFTHQKDESLSKTAPKVIKVKKFEKK